MKFIQRFAVKRELFDRACTVILEGMKGLRELCVVWRDWRPVGETWEMRGVGFREVEEGVLMGRGRENSHSELGFFFFFFWRCVGVFYLPSSPGSLNVLVSSLWGCAVTIFDSFSFSYLC